MNELTERELWLVRRGYREGRDDGYLDARGDGHLGYASADEWLADSAMDGATVAQLLAQLAPAEAEQTPGIYTTDIPAGATQGDTVSVDFDAEQHGPEPHPFVESTEWVNCGEANRHGCIHGWDPDEGHFDLCGKHRTHPIHRVVENQ